MKTQSILGIVAALSLIIAGVIASSTIAFQNAHAITVTARAGTASATASASTTSGSSASATAGSCSAFAGIFAIADC